MAMTQNWNLVSPTAVDKANARAAVNAAGILRAVFAWIGRPEV
jgi:hypothetical protein